MMPADRATRTVGITLASVLVIGVLLLVAAVTSSRKVSTIAQQAVQAKAAPASRVMDSMQTTTLAYTNTTFVNLNKDCATFTDTMFIQNVIQQMSWNGVSDTVVVNAVACGSMTVFYQCVSTTSSKAQSNCALLKTRLQDRTSTLSQILLVTRPDIYNDDGTCNNAIFAIYTLCILPLFCCGGFLLWYRLKQQQADSQYLQDTATFSNVAARQPHAPYDPSAVPVAYQPSPMAPSYTAPMAPSYTAPQYGAPQQMYPQYAPQQQFQQAPAGYGYAPQQ